MSSGKTPKIKQNEISYCQIKKGSIVNISILFNLDYRSDILEHVISGTISSLRGPYTCFTGPSFLGFNFEPPDFIVATHF